MRLVVGGLFVILLFPNAGFAACDPTIDPDKSDIADARAAVQANCSCTGFATHGTYVNCAAEQANAALQNQTCRAAVKRCAAKSTCGQPGFVTCCRTNRKGSTKCGVKRDAAHCTAPKAGTACVGTSASCCDACTSSGCATTTTSTTTSVTTTTIVFGPCGGPGSVPAPLCWGECPPEAPICAAGGPSGCQCVAGTTPCDAASFFECDGACDVDAACAVGLDLGCTCEFRGLPCSISYALTGSCGGVCPPDNECLFVSTPDGEGCSCNPIGSTCYGTYPVCDGTCRAGQTCQDINLPGLCFCQ